METNRIGSRILFDELTTIEQKPLLIPEGSTGYIIEMLNQWLKWAPPKHECPTLTALAIALQKSGQETIAATLREQFNQRKGIIMCVCMYIYIYIYIPCIEVTIAECAERLTIF